MSERNLLILRHIVNPILAIAAVFALVLGLFHPWRDDAGAATRQHIATPTYTRGLTPILVPIDGRKIRCLVLVTNPNLAAALSCDWRG